MSLKYEKKKITFKEIKEIEKKQKPLGSRVAKLVSRFIKMFLGIILLCFSVVFIIVAISLEPVLSTYSSVKVIQDEFTALVNVDLPSKNLTKLDQRFDKIESSLTVAESQFSSFDFLNSFSITRGYYENLVHIRDLVRETKTIFTKIRPELKEILKTAGYQVDATTETTKLVQSDSEKDKNLQELVKILPDLISLYDNIELDLLDTVKTVNKIDPNYLPSSLRDKIIEVQTQTKPLEENFGDFSNQITGTLSVLPDLLGVNKSVNYLIIFQNEKELRASGGLLTAYGNMTIKNGEIVGDITSTDMWDLEIYVSSTLRKAPNYQNIYGQEFLMLRGCGDLHLRAQDAGIYPDGQISINMFKDYYNVASRANPKKYPPYDHIVMLNTFLASDLIRLVEPIKLSDGRSITGDNIAKVIFSQTNKNRSSQRKSIIGDIGDVLKSKYEELPSSELPKVLSTLIKTIQAKNIILSSKSKTVLEFMDSMGMTGRIEKDFVGDYFSLSEAQVCALKANFYIKDTVEHNVNIDKNGKIKNTVNITWSNSKVFDARERDILSDSSNYLYRAWIRLMTPKGTTFTASTGKVASRGIYDPIQYYESKMDKQIADSVTWFDHRRASSKVPVKSLKLTVAYTLPKTIIFNQLDGYRMLIQKHPGKEDEKYIFNLTHDGIKYKEEFTLDRDKVVVFKNGLLEVQNYDHPLDKIQSVIDNF